MSVSRLISMPVELAKYCWSVGKTGLHGGSHTPGAISVISVGLVA